MPITVKHDAPAAAYGIPAFYAGQEDLRRYMDKMEQQRAQMMLQAQQAREENAVKVALAGAQLEAQANNQRAGQMHDFQKMQFGAGLNAAQDKVNFEQQQAFQQAGQNFQAAENKKAQDAIAARMEQARQDQATAKAEYMKQQEEAAKKAEAQKQQDRLNALPVQTTRQIQEQDRSNALLSSIDVATGGMIPDVVKYDAANIVATQQSQKTPQQVARDTLLQTHDFSPADAKKMADAEKQMASIQAATIEPDRKRAMLQPLEDLIQNTMPSVRRPKLSEQVEVDDNGATLSRAKDGSIKRSSPEKLNDVDKMYAYGKDKRESAKDEKGMTTERLDEIERAARAEYERDQRKSRELTKRVAKGEDEDKVRADLERRYPAPAPQPTPAPSGSQPAVPGASTPAGQQSAPQVQQQAGPVMPAGMTPKSGAAWRWASGDRSGGYTQEEIDKHNGVQAPTAPVTAADVKEVIQQPDLSGFNAPDAQGVVFQDKSFEGMPYRVAVMKGGFEVQTPNGTFSASSEDEAKAIVTEHKHAEAIDLVGVYDKNKNYRSGLASKEAREAHQALNGTSGVELKNGKPFQKHDFSMFKPVPRLMQEKYGVIGVLPPGSMLNQGGEEAPLMVNDDKYTSKLPAGTVYYVKTAEGKIQRRQITKSPAREN